MEDFEARLKRLRLRPPSEGLDARVLSSSGRSARRRAVPAWLAAAASLVMGLVGFAAGLAVRDGDSRPAARPPFAVEVIQSSPGQGNPFDFTCASDIVYAKNPEDAPPREKEM